MLVDFWLLTGISPKNGFKASWTRVFFFIFPLHFFAIFNDFSKWSTPKVQCRETLKNHQLWHYHYSPCRTLIYKNHKTAKVYLNCWFYGILCLVICSCLTDPTKKVRRHLLAAWPTFSSVVVVVATDGCVHSRKDLDYYTSLHDSVGIRCPSPKYENGF